MMAATDSRFFTAICDRVYRYAPFRMTKAQRESIHSYDEHLGVDDFVDGVALVPAPDREDPLMSDAPSRPAPTGRCTACSRSSASWSASSSPAASCRATTRRSSATSPTTSAIADADVNWFEAAQLIVSALCVPLLARLGDLVGHKKVLLLSTAVTALGSWILAFAPGFTTFLIGWAIQGAYVVWLPLEVAIIYRRTADTGRQALLTRRVRRDPGRRPRAVGDHRRADQRRAGRVDVDDRAAGAARRSW